MTATTSREQAKQYLASHRIPQMFECLLSCLMMERPEDPVTFIETKMSEIKRIGVRNVNWETFVLSMHPYRDPVRREYIRDGSKYDIEREQEEEVMKKEKEQRDAYKPEVFSLTETDSST